MSRCGIDSSEMAAVLLLCMLAQVLLSKRICKAY